MIELSELIKNVFCGYEDDINEFIELNNLSNNEIIKFKNLIISYIVTTRSSVIDDLFILLKDFKEKSFNEKYYELINYLITNGDSGTLEMLEENVINNGVCFHSFNSSFLDNVKSNGLVFEEKLWDTKDLDIVRNIFKKYGNNYIFGLYQGGSKTPLYFAKTLDSSEFYSLASPSWFCHFCSGGMRTSPLEYDRQAFYNRNYKNALGNVKKAISYFTIEEQEIVLAFFEREWKNMASNNLPSLAIVPQELVGLIPITLEKYDTESSEEYLIRRIKLHQSGNKTVRNSIGYDELILFNYDNGLVDNFNLVK